MESLAIHFEELLNVVVRKFVLVSLSSHFQCLSLLFVWGSRSSHLDIQESLAGMLCFVVTGWIDTLSRSHVYQGLVEVVMKLI